MTHWVLSTDNLLKSWNTLGFTPAKMGSNMIKTSNCNQIVCKWVDVQQISTNNNNGQTCWKSLAFNKNILPIIGHFPGPSWKRERKRGQNSTSWLAGASLPEPKVQASQGGKSPACKRWKTLWKRWKTKMEIVAKMENSWKLYGIHRKSYGFPWDFSGLRIAASISCPITSPSARPSRLRSCRQQVTSDHVDDITIWSPCLRNLNGDFIDFSFGITNGDFTNGDFLFTKFYWWFSSGINDINQGLLFYSWLDTRWHWSCEKDWKGSFRI